MLTHVYDVLDALPKAIRLFEDAELSRTYPELRNAYGGGRFTNPRVRLAWSKSALKAVAARTPEHGSSNGVQGASYSYYDIEQLAEHLSDQV